jgi:hypothetical protein
MAGDLDGACGPLSLWAALIVLGVATRSQVICQKYQFTNDKFGATWLRSLDLWFKGARDEEMDGLLKSVSPFARSESCTASMRRQVEFSIEHLQQNSVVLLGLRRLVGDIGHWTCAVGVEEIVNAEDRQAIGILCLDSSQPPPVLLRYNARLELHVPRKGATYVRFRGLTGGARLVTIERSIALSRKQPAERAHMTVRTKSTPAGTG